jgi:ABC-type nitrate/sulfonate/bicarbonate transport system permease component
MLVGVAAIGLTGLLIDFILLQLQHRLLKWNSIWAGEP